MVTAVSGKYQGTHFGVLISDNGLTANLYLKDGKAYKVFNTTAKKSDVYKEAYLTAFIESTGIPAAAVHSVRKEDGHWVLEMDYVDGKLMLMELVRAVEQKDYARAGKLLDDLASIQYSFHQIEANDLPDYRTGIVGKLRSNPVLSPEQVSRLIARLNTLPGGNALLHGDYHPGNIIYLGSQPVVLDWFTAGAGNPACDVARTYLKMLHAPVPWGTGDALHGPDRYLNTYCSLSGLSREDVAGWFPIVAGMCCNGIDKVFNQNMLQYLL